MSTSQRTCLCRRAIWKAMSARREKDNGPAARASANPSAAPPDPDIPNLTRDPPAWRGSNENCSPPSANVRFPLIVEIRQSRMLPLVSDNGYVGGPTRGGKWGCALAALVGVPVGIFLMIVDALGDCAPDVSCGKGFWTHVALPTLIVVIAVGLPVRWLLNRRSK